MMNIVVRLLGSYLNVLSRIAPRVAARHAFNLFCHPFRTRLKSHQREFLDSAERFHFTHKNTRLQGYKWGNGARKVLLLHGWQSHTFRWKNYIQKLLAQDTTVYAFDAPGHGQSAGRFLSVPVYSDAISQFISEHGAMDTVVAHSIGSFAIVHALHRMPLLPISQLVLMAPPGEASDFADHFRERLKLTPRTLNLMLEYFQHKFEHPITYYATRRFANSLTVPGLIVHDVDDNETPFTHALEIHKIWKRSMLIKTRGLGHNLRSAEVTKIVCDYAAGISGPTPDAPTATQDTDRIAVILPH